MKLTMIVLLSLLFPRQDSLLVVSWNVENFLDYRSDTTGRHTASRFYAKCNAVAKTLLLIADGEGRLPDAVALMEVGNRFVLERLLRSTPLRKLDYAIVHYDSPDRRGIDCALLYRRSSLRLRRSHPSPLRDTSGAVMHTRDILVAEFDSLCILVNHHPSKVGPDSGRRRAIAMARMNVLMDSLSRAETSYLSLPDQESPPSIWRRSDCDAGTRAANADSVRSSGAGVDSFFRPAPKKGGPAPSAAAVFPVLAVGDFNDDVWRDGSPGTIKYNGAWEKIDGHFARGLRVREKVFAAPVLSEEDRTWGGSKPRRTFSGPRYLGGVSDHFPVILWVFPE